MFFWLFAGYTTYRAQVNSNLSSGQGEGNDVSQFLIGGRAREPLSDESSMTWGSSRADGRVRMGEDTLETQLLAAHCASLDETLLRCVAYAFS